MDSSILKDNIVEILDGKKAKGITVIKMFEIAAFTDYFIVCSGTSNIHMRAMSDELYDNLGKQGVTPMNVSGYDSASWILMDYGNVIVHIFNAEAREFYNIERLWADGIINNVDKSVSS